MIVDPKEIENCKVTKGVVIWFLGGPSLAFRSQESIVYLDLFTGPSPSPEAVTKAIPETIDPAAIRRADLAISTHFDEDHCNQRSLTHLHENTSSIFLGPVSCNNLYQEWGFDLARQRQLAVHESFIKRDITIHACPSKDAFDPDALTYIIETGGIKIFDGGDTLYLPELDEIGNNWDLDIAFLSYAKNPPDKVYYLDEEAVMKAADDLKAKIIILKHYDLWKQFEIDPIPLVEQLKSRGHDARVFSLGERFEYQG